MASTYSDLGIELMATGENAGTWGTKTNTNLTLIEQIAGGYVSVSIAGGAGTQALDIDNGALTGEAQNRVIEFTGTISGNRVITVPVNTENFYFIKNNTSGSYTVQLKADSGSGATVTFATGNKGWKVVYFDGVATNTGVYEIEIDTVATPAGFGGDSNFIWNSSTGLNIGSQKELRLQDTTGGEYVGLKSAGTATSYTMTLPAAVGSASQALVTTDGSGTLGFTSTSTFGISTGKAIAMAIVFG